MKNLQNLTKIIRDKFKEMSLFKKIITSLVAVLLVWFIFNSSKSITVQEEYEFAPVSRGSVQSTISESGEIISTGTVGVPSTINGVVKDVFITNGQVVNKGDDLFSVTSTATDEERASAYSSYKSAQTSLDSAKNSHLSKQATVERVYDEISGHDNDETFDIKETRVSAETARDNAYLSVVSAQASLTKAWYAYQATTNGVVRATANGTVANLSIANGQTVSNQENALLIVADNDVWIKISVTENDVVDLKPGQKAVISVDALSSEKLTGEVVRIDTVGTVESDVVTYGVYLLVDPTTANLMPSMTVSVDITTSSKEDVLVVPNSAIKPYQGSRAVQILDNKTGQLLYVPIKIGVAGILKSEVLRGLKEGQEIIVSTNSDTPASTQSQGFSPFGGH